MEALADKVKWSQDSEGIWLNLRVADAKRLCEKVKVGKTYDIKITEHRQKRSLDANAYFFVLLDKLAAEMNLPKEDIYRRYIREIGGVSEMVCVKDSAVEKLCESWKRNGLGWQTDTLPSKLKGCTNVVLYYGSSCFDVAQMNRLITMVVEDCRAVGIETKTPYELAGLLEEWGR